MNGMLRAAAAATMAVCAGASHAAVVVVTIAGNVGAASDSVGPKAFSGQFTYDTSKITYDSTQVIYGSDDGSNDAGTYSYTLGAVTYSGAVRAVLFQQLATCEGGYAGPCGRVDVHFSGPVPGYDAPRLIVDLAPQAPFDGHYLPDVAISSAGAYFASLMLPEALVGDRYAVTSNNPILIPTQRGASLVFGPADGGVPEPATWAMMVAGFGLVGAAMRRRSTRIAFA